jgi:hypothetical protein
MPLVMRWISKVRAMLRLQYEKGDKKGRNRKERRQESRKGKEKYIITRVNIKT